MSLNRFGKKTLTGEDDLEVDRINIGVNSNFGTSGQILKKSSTDNSLTWGEETNYSATLPIVLTGTNLSFDTGNPQSNTIRKQIVNNLQNFYIGDTIKLQEQNGLCQVLDLNTNQSNVFNSGSYKVFEGTSSLKLNISKTAFTPNSQIYEVGLSSYPIYKTHSQQLLIYDQNQSLKLSINKLGITPETNNYFIGTSAKPIHEIISTSQNIQSILYVGDLDEDFITFTKDNISGGNQGGVSNFKHMTLTSSISARRYFKLFKSYRWN